MERQGSRERRPVPLPRSEWQSHRLSRFRSGSVCSQRRRLMSLAGISAACGEGAAETRQIAAERLSAFNDWCPCWGLCMRLVAIRRVSPPTLGANGSSVGSSQSGHRKSSCDCRDNCGDGHEPGRRYRELRVCCDTLRTSGENALTRGAAVTFGRLPQPLALIETSRWRTRICRLPATIRRHRALLYLSS